MKVLGYLKNHTIDDLIEKYSLKSAYHPELPLVILNYSMINTPWGLQQTDIVRECRSLVLNTQTKQLVARGFKRFHNWGQAPEEQEKFDFDNFAIETKEDGSLILIFKYEDQWLICTRGSFAQFPLDVYPQYTWESLVKAVLGTQNLNDLESQYGWNPKYTYVLELTSPFNHVVREYKKTELTLLSVFNGVKELSRNEANTYAIPEKIKVLDKHSFDTIDDAIYWLNNINEEGRFEGFVVRDKNDIRFKIKGKRYFEVFGFLYNTGQKLSIESYLDFLRDGEKDELLSTFPELQKAYEKLEVSLLQSMEKIKSYIETMKTQTLKEAGLSLRDTDDLESRVAINYRRKERYDMTDKELWDELWDQRKAPGKKATLAAKLLIRNVKLEIEDIQVELP